MLSSSLTLRRLTVSNAQCGTQFAARVCLQTTRCSPAIPECRLLSFATSDSSAVVWKRLRRRSFTIQQYQSRSYSANQANLKPKEEEEDVPPATPTPPSQTSIPSETAKSTTSLVRPEISPSAVPFLPPSALDSPHPNAPPAATSTIREAIADYLEAERSGHVSAPGPEITNKFRILYFRAKQLFKFYWSGIKLLRTNFMDMRTLQKGRKTEGWVLTRRELRFIERTQGDLIRLIPFVVLFATVEELIPLMVLYSPWMLPSTTILPSQLLRIKAGEEQKRRSALLSMGKHIKDISQAILPKNVQGLDTLEVNGLCRALDVGNIAPEFWLKRRLQSRLDWLKKDDALLRRSADLSALTIEERRTALGQRGLLALYATPEELYSTLNEWLYRTMPESASSSQDFQASPSDTTDARMLSLIFEHAVKTVEEQEQGSVEKEDE